MDILVAYKLLLHEAATQLWVLAITVSVIIFAIFLGFVMFKLHSFEKLLQRYLDKKNGT